MHVSFWFGTNVGSFLFEGYSISSLSGLICTCLGIIAVAVLFDALKLAIVNARQQVAELLQVNAEGVVNSTEVSLLLNNRSSTTVKPNARKCLMSYGHIFMFTTHELISYLLMLVVMTYNGYFIISTVVGAGLGYFIFSPTMEEITFRRNSSLYPRMFCKQCIVKSRETAKSDEESGTLRRTAEGVAQVVAQSFKKFPPESIGRTNGEEPHHSTEVAVDHSSHEGVC